MVVVLPEPLTPTTRMTCGRGKATISSGRRQHRLNFFSNQAAQRRLVKASVIAATGEFGADARGHRWAKIGDDQRVLDPVKRFGIQLATAEQAEQIVAEPV